MSLTDSTKQLLIVAMQDLADAKLAWTERSPSLASAAGRRVADFLTDNAAASQAQRDGLCALLDKLGAARTGDPNIWLRAILDDADRDVRSTIEGPLRDVALIGAFRKGKQAERVSHETAIALATSLGEAGAATEMGRFRDEAAAADHSLAALLSSTVDSL